MQDNAIFLSDNLMTFIVILKAPSQDFTWCQKGDEPSNMDVAGLQCPQMDWEAENLPERWKRFRQHVELMFSGPLSSKKEEEKCSYLLIWCGKKGRDIINKWSGISEEDKKKLKAYFSRAI